MCFKIKLAGVILLAAGLSAMTGCARSTATPTLQQNETSPESEIAIGRVIPQVDVVEQGEDEDSLIPIVDENELFSGEWVRVRDGGEGVLDLGDQLLLRLQAEATLGGVLTPDPSIRRELQIFLLNGVISGQQTLEDGRTVYPLPGGARVTVLGTDFFLIYDRDQALALVGNFGGTVIVESQGVRLDLPDGQMVRVPDGQPPQAPFPMNLNLGQFQRLGRDLGSPGAVIAELEQILTPTITLTREPTITDTAITATKPPTPTPSPTPLFETGRIVVKQGTPGTINLVEVHPDGELTILVGGVEDADVLDYTRADNGKYAIRAVDGELHTLWIVRIDGSVIAAEVNPGWMKITDGDWSPDGSRLIIEAEENGPRYFYFDGNGKLLASPQFPNRTPIP